MVPYELLQDLNKLVCSSRNKKVEDLFIKLANEDEGKEDNFLSWIIKMNDNKVLSSAMSTPILKALNVLYYRGEEYNKSPKSFLKQMFSSETSKEAKSLFDVYEAFNELMKQPSYQAVLLPFKPFLSNIKNNDPDATTISAQVSKDLNFLIDKYKEHLHEMSRPHRLDSESFEESNLDQKAIRNERERRMRLHQTYAFFLKHFTEEISTSLSNDYIWDKVKPLLRNNKIDQYSEIAMALPYIPNIKKAPEVVNKTYKDIMGGTDIKRFGLIGFFNVTRRRLFDSLDISTGLGTLPSSTENITFDNTKYMELGEVPDDVDVMEHQNVSKEPQKVEQYDYTKVRSCAYILSVSVLMSRLREAILQFKATKYAPIKHQRYL
jgi:hypothetical protein